MTEEMLRGRDDLQKFLGVNSWNTVRKWRSQGMPVFSGPDGRPMGIPYELRQWLVIREKKIQLLKKT